MAETDGGQAVVRQAAAGPAGTGGALAQIVNEADTQLKGIDQSPFSAQAFKALQEQISSYIAELIRESVREAKRQQLDTVSETHVERASDYLVSKADRKILRHAGTLGGVFLGASISNLLAMASSSTVTFASVGLTTALGVIGAFAIALHIARD